MDKFSAAKNLELINESSVNCVVFISSSADIDRLRGFAAIKRSYPFISAVGVNIDKSNLTDMVKLDCVKAITGQTFVKISDIPKNEIGKSVHSLYPDLGNLHAKGICGSGVTVAVIDSGIMPHLDFVMPKNRVKFLDFVGSCNVAYDDNGHGTAVAGILCGNGLISCGLNAGVAPHANLIALKAVNSGGEGATFNILSAMQWVFSNHKAMKIKVLNLSFGTEPINGVDPLKIGAEALWKSGVTVVCSAGNSGPGEKTIKSPGISSKVITVGGAQYIGENWNVAEFSSRGQRDAATKPDIIAPGVNIVTAATQNFYAAYSGTSMSAPMTAGVCALLLGKNPNYTPDKIKETLIGAASKLNCAAYDCGRGLLKLPF